MIEPDDPFDPWSVIAADRWALADLLDTLSPEQWATPSLCGEWSVKEVATHVSAGPTGSMAEFAVAMLRARGRFDRANVIMVERRSALSYDEVSGLLRQYAEDRFTPPSMDWHAPLSDLRIHTADICVPLGLDPGRPVGPWADVLDFLVSRAARRGFVPPGRPDGTFTATDLEWSHGSGPDVRGPAQALALALCGRPAQLDRLTGPGVGALRGWLGA